MLGIDPLELCAEFLREQRVAILTGGQHIEGGVDAEQDHLDITGLRSQLCDLRVMGADANMADDTGLFEAHDVIQIIRVLDLGPILLGVHIVDHAEIDVVRLQALQKVFKRRAHVLYVSASKILTVLPGGADVALDIPVAAVVPDAFADDVPGCRVCHPAVENVDPLCGGVVDQLNALCLGVPLQPFPTEANLTDLQPGLSQSSVPHDGCSSHYICFIIPWEMRGINCKKTCAGACPAQGSMFCFIRRCGGRRCTGLRTSFPRGSRS